MKSREKIVEQLKEDLRKTREELAIQKWGNEKTLEGMKVLVTEIIQRNKELEEAQARDKEINRLKSDFISLASHQLRTPLTGMEWTAELFAKKEKLTNQGKQYLQDIKFSAHRLNALVKLLLNASRVESGKVEVKPEAVEVVSFIEELIKKCEVLCDKKQLALSFLKHPPKLVAVTDSDLLEQIIQNILSNAIEYTLAGGKITVSLEEKKETFIFAVSDTGIGIPKKEQARIFERFIRASNAASLKPDGTGLGLYIVAEAAKLLEGKVWFESEEGHGSTFYAELPLQSQVKEGEKKLIDHPFE